MRVSTLLCLATALLLTAPGAVAQAKYTFPMGHDRASGLQPTTSGTMDAVVIPDAQQMRGPGITESFDDITTLPGDGWSLQNLSDEVGTTTWFQGNAAVFPSNSGDPTAYIGANFNSTTGTNTINTWLLTPETALDNGTTITFFTRTGPASNFPDRLEVRLSTAGASTNAGTDASNVGDFTTLLLEINPTLTVGGYPETWTQFTATLSGLAGPTTGRVGFRYFVTDGGPTGANSNFIGIDDVVVATAIAGPSLSVSPSSVMFGQTPINTTASQTVTLTNNGTSTLTISSVSVSGDPTVTITQPGSLSLAAGASTTMMVMFAPTATGAASATVTIASDSPGSPATLAVTGTGFDPSSGPTTYPSADTPISIPDNNPAGITSTIVVPGTSPGNVADLDVDLNITHTWVGDLIVSLAKGSATASIADRPGLPTTAAGCSSNNMVIVADDEGTAGAIETACEGLASAAEAYTAGGRYTPNDALSAFDGTTVAGTYTLTISDNVGADLGTLNSWALIITPSTVATSAGPSGLSALTVAPNPVASEGRVSLTVASAQDVRVALYDVTGREVMLLLDRAMTAGQQAHIAFRTQDLPAGVYVIRATGTDVSLTERVTVVR